MLIFIKRWNRYSCYYKDRAKMSPQSSWQLCMHIRAGPEAHGLCSVFSFNSFHSSFHVPHSFHFILSVLFNCFHSINSCIHFIHSFHYIQSFRFIFHMSWHFISYMHAYNHAGKLLHVCSKLLGGYWMGSVHAPARTGNYSTPTRKLLQHALKTLGILWTASAYACLGQTCDK